MPPITPVKPPTEHTRALKNLGPLHELLLKACPPDPHGIKSIPILAKALDMSTYGVYKWIENVKVPPDQAVRIVEASRGPKDPSNPDALRPWRVTIDDFYPYVFS